MIGRQNKYGLSIFFIFLCHVTFLAQTKVKVLKVDALLEKIQKNNDTVYVVNFWATWCKPCVAELPDFEKVHKEYSGKQVKIIIVSLDFKEQLKKKVIPFLKKNKYSMECVLLDEIDGNVFIDKISKEWTGAIPATVFLKNCKNLFFERKLDQKILKENIDTLLAK